QVLENLNWKIYRIWSPDWFRDRDQVLSDLTKYLNDNSAEFPSTPESSAEQQDDNQPSPKHGAAPEFVSSASELPAGVFVYMDHVGRTPNKYLASWIGELVAREGPLHEDELLRALRLDHHYGSLGSNIRYQFMQGINSAISNGFIVRRSNWYWPKGMNTA